MSQETPTYPPIKNFIRDNIKASLSKDGKFTRIYFGPDDDRTCVSLSTAYLKKVMKGKDSAETAPADQAAEVAE